MIDKTINEMIDTKVKEKLGEIIKEIDNWLRFHEKMQSTFTTDALTKHLMKKFLV